MGYIYLIKNNVNNKVYIGQTIRTINKRWQGHVYLVGKSNKELYKDMEIYGIHSFTIKEIEKCENSKLNDREKYYIRLYDSFNNGYNNTLGGSGSSTSNITDELILNIIDDIDNMSIKELCIKYNISSTTLKQIRFEYGILTDIDITYTNEKHSIIMYDDTFDKGVLFESKLSALKYLGVDYRNFYREVGIACQNGNVVYGHRWQLVSDLVYEDKIFRTKFDKEAYIQGKQAYQPEGKQYWIVDGALDTIFKKYKIRIRKRNTTDNKCIDCGINICKESKRCRNCNNKLPKNTCMKYICKQCGRPAGVVNYNGLCNSCYNVIAKGKSPKPSKEELKALLDQNLQKKQIAEMYERTPSTIHYWINDYGLR